MLNTIFHGYLKLERGDLLRETYDEREVGCICRRLLYQIIPMTGRRRK